jgi:hypothetical protein
MTARETILNSVERFGDKVFLVDANTGREITYREFHQQALFEFAACARATVSA